MMNRRDMLRGLAGLGVTAGLGNILLGSRAQALPHFAPRARRVIHMFMSGGPSQLETFDYKPGLAALDGSELPASVRGMQRLTTMTSTQGSFPVAAPRVGFTQHGASGAWVSDWFPQTGSVADKICILRTVHTDQINHEPAVTFMQTGHALAGRPSIGSWLSYGLESEAADLPPFAVLVSTSNVPFGQPLATRYWGSGFLPANHQGVQIQGGPEPVFYVEDGARLSQARRERLRDTRNALDALHAPGDAAVMARMQNYALATRMQTSVPRVMSLADEPESTWTLYGDEARTPGSYAWSCVTARRLIENDVRYVQLYHRDWDHHSSMQIHHPAVARDTDRASAALLQDLERRGLLDDTLLVWGGEFGRTVYSQGAVTRDYYGRDHHPRCFSMWMAGGGIRGGLVHGATDDFSYNVVENPVSVHDLHATMLHLLGFDHERLVFRSEGRDFRLTDVSGRVVSEILT